jgi:hypothetical protein
MVNMDSRKESSNLRFFFVFSLSFSTIIISSLGSSCYVFYLCSMLISRGEISSTFGPSGSPSMSILMIAHHSSLGICSVKYPRALARVN